MGGLLSFIVSGLTTGSVYGLAAVGLVLTYKTSGVFNFAHGALATVAAYLFYTLHEQHRVNWVLAAAICILVVAPVLAVGLEQIARPLSGASLATRVVTMVGALLLVQAVVTLIYGTSATRTVKEFLPKHNFRVGGTVVFLPQIIIFCVGMVAATALYVFFKRARLGLAMRAVVENPTLLDIEGTSPVAVRRAAWMVGVAFACIAGILLISIPPPQDLEPLNLTFLVVAAFGAAAIGSFSSLPMTYLGALAIGLAESLCTKYFTSGVLNGLAASMPFIILFIVLLVSPRSRLVDRSPIISRSTSSWRCPPLVQVVLGVMVLILLCCVPLFAGVHLQDYSDGLALSVLFLSLGLLTRTSGQVSLAHVSFMAIGVCAFAHLAGSAHLPWLAALLLAGLITVPIGALLSIPSIRLSGLYLALATFGFGILLQYMFYDQGYMFGPSGAGVSVHRPKLSFINVNTDTGYYYLLLLIALSAAVAMLALNRSRLGRLLRALSDSPTGLATSGTSVNVTRVLVFCISAFIAAAAGVFQAGALAAGGVAIVNGDSYQPLTSLIYFTLIVIAAGAVPWYVLPAAFGLTLIPSYISSANTMNWLTVSFGVFALLFAVMPHGSGPPLAIRNFLDRSGGIWSPPRRRVTGAAATGWRPPVVRSGSLRVEHLRVTFGGLVAVDGVDLEAPTGRITGLIGPNGAGKTTIFNACSGLNRSISGRVLIDDVDASRRGPASRARRGIGRTFQQTELFDSLTVRENVALGMEGARAGSNVFTHLLATRGDKERMGWATEEALRRCGIVDLAEVTVGSLSTGQRRLVELARCLAGQHHILLLDEPSSGLDQVETEHFGRILLSLVGEQQMGILLVEHDMRLVSQVCDYIYVIDFGRLIFEGVPSEVMSSPLVQAAYLGDEAVEVAATAGGGGGASELGMATP